MAPFPYLESYVAFNIVLHIFEQYLTYRQLKKKYDIVIPEDAKRYKLVDSDEEFLASQNYKKDSLIFGMIVETINFIFGMWFFIKIQPYLWVYSGTHSENEMIRTVIWVILQDLFQKPLSIVTSAISTFYIEEKHGFNKTTVSTFITDLIKSFVISLVLQSLIFPAIIWVMYQGGDNFYLYLWGSFQAFILIFLFIKPHLIDPLFNKYEELQNVELKEKIQTLASSLKFPLTKLFQVDGSKRSSHSNAYFYGFWKNQRIVLFDTLLHLEHDSILAILCHELGHWFHSHILRNLLIASVHLFFICFWFKFMLYSSYLQDIYHSFGYFDTDARIIGFVLFSAMISPIEQFVGIFMTLLSRMFEFQADAFAVKQGYAEPLKEGLKTINKENKGDLNPDTWYAWFHYTHPSLVERLKAIDDLEILREKKQE